MKILYDKIKNKTYSFAETKAELSNDTIDCTKDVKHYTSKTYSFAETKAELSNDTIDCTKDVKHYTSKTYKNCVQLINSTLPANIENTKLVETNGEYELIALTQQEIAEKEATATIEEKRKEFFFKNVKISVDWKHAENNYLSLVLRSIVDQDIHFSIEKVQDPGTKKFIITGYVYCNTIQQDDYDVLSIDNKFSFETVTDASGTDILNYVV